MITFSGKTGGGVMVTFKQIKSDMEDGNNFHIAMGLHKFSIPMQNTQLHDMKSWQRTMVSIASNKNLQQLHTFHPQKINQQNFFP